jgi:beta-lactamase class A
MVLHDRRTVMIGAVSLAAMACTPRAVSREDDQSDSSSLPALAKALEALEAKSGGRLGVFVLDTQTGTRTGWRAGERFAHCSSFKLSLAAMFLSMSDRGEIDLAERLHWTEADLLHHSPVTVRHVATGLTIEELAHGTLVTSDNTAANVLLKRAGGPQMLTQFWRALGDNVSRLDRYEPEMNMVPLGTELDTTTPEAMADTLAKLVTGDVLRAKTRDKLNAWMAEVQTGTRRIRAGLPAGWIAGDKTGTGIGELAETYVDIAYAGPADRKPLIITAYYNPGKRSDMISPEAEAVLAQVGHLAARSISGPVGAFLAEPFHETLQPRPALL